MNRRQVLESLHTGQLDKIARLILHRNIEESETKEDLIQMLDTDESDKEARRVYGDQDLLHLIYSYSKNDGLWSETREKRKKKERDELMRDVFMYRHIADLLEQVAQGEIKIGAVIQELREAKEAAEAEDNCSKEEWYEIILNNI